MISVEHFSQNGSLQFQANNIPARVYISFFDRDFVDHKLSRIDQLLKVKNTSIFELPHEKTNILHMRKQRRRSASR